MAIDDQTAPPQLARPERAKPRRTGWLAAGSVVAGILLAVVWSFELVDHVIGDSIANPLLGHDAKATAIGGPLAGLSFALVSGLAGTFTACNIAMIASIGPMSHASKAIATTAQ